MWPQKLKISKSMDKVLSIKQNDSFWRFWFAQLISQFGDRVHQMALVGLIALRAPGSAFELAKLLAFTIIPVFIIGPFAGVYVDRWDRRTTMFICDMVRGFIVLGIAMYWMHLTTIVWVYAAVFGVFALSRFHVPAKMSFIPQMVNPEDLHIANSLVSVTGMIALVVGALLGGILVENVGSQGGFLWDAATYFISAGLVVSISRLRKPKLDKQRIKEVAREMINVNRSVWAEMAVGINYIANDRRLKMIFILMSILFAAAGAVYVVIIVFIQKSFGTVTKDLGFLAIPLGVGLFLGSLAYGKWGAKADKFKTVFWSLIGGGLMVAVFTICVGVTQQRGMAMGLSALLGFVLGPIVIAANTIVHEVTSSEMSGKVFSALEVVMHLGFLVAMLLSSWLAERIAPMWILVSVGGIFLGVGCFGLIFHRSLKVRT